MLGWNIFIKNEANETLATWVTGLGGLDWVDELVELGSAELVCAGGYPTCYKLLAKHVLPFLRSRTLPSYKQSLVISDASVSKCGLKSGMLINEITLFKCADDVWLIVEAWDQS